MQAVTANSDGQALYIQGRNFRGEITLKGNTLTLGITEFKKGGVFFTDITNALLEKDFRRFLVFKKVEDLYDELIINQHLEISDENALLLPIEVTFKQKNFQLKVEIPLEQRKFNNQAEKFQLFLEQLDKINNQLGKINNSKKKLQRCIKLISFNGDKTNANYKQFEVSDNARHINFIGQSAHTPFVHEKPLPNKGIFQFKVKIIKTASKSIFLGVCGKDIRQKLNSEFYSSCLFIGGYLGNTNGFYLYGKITKPVAPAITIVEGQSIFKIEVNMNRKLISFYYDNFCLYTAQFSKEMENSEVYPLVSLASNGDTVKFIDE